MNVLLKSGTNDFHGSVYEYNINQDSRSSTSVLFKAKRAFDSAHF